MSGRPHVGRTAVALALLVGMVACTGSSRPSTEATVVLFDVSASIRPDAIRARYGQTFGLVIDHLREAGGVLGADIIDANPLVHGDLPINETFSRRTLGDNSLDCRKAFEGQERRTHEEAGTILATSSLLSRKFT
ncbi:MAG TPA: hypothetical protein VE669_02360 [Actinomycetota bacterium]|jgi:hypothetical protein|nr:hypothetical protein [Actinomycetota bacterium]